MSEYKTYKVTNKTTGETFSFKSASKPTQEDIKHISSLRAKTKRAAEISDAIERESGGKPEALKVHEPGMFEGIKNTIAGLPGAETLGRLLYAPSEAIAPEPMEQEKVEKLPLLSRAGRLGREFGSMLIDPSNLPGLAAPLALGPVGVAGAALAYAPQMLKGTYESGKEFVEHPSLESGARAGLSALGTAGLGFGFREGMKGYTDIGSKAPTVKHPIKPTARGMIEGAKPKLIPERAPIDVDFVEHPYVPPAPPHRAALQEKILQIDGDVPLTEEGAIRARASNLPEQRLLEEPQMRQLGEGGGPLITPPPTEEIPGQKMLPGRRQGLLESGEEPINAEFVDEDAPIVVPPSSIESELETKGLTGRDPKLLEAYYGNLSKSKTSTLISRLNKNIHPKERTLVEDILKKRGALPDETEELPVPELPQEELAQQTATQATQEIEPEITVSTPEEIVPKTKKTKKEILPTPRPSLEDMLQQSIEAKKENIPGINKKKVTEVTEAPVEKKIEPQKIENSWLNQQETEFLKQMLPGSRGQIAREITQVLSERGEFPKEKIIEVKAPTKAAKSTKPAKSNKPEVDRHKLIELSAEGDKAADNLLDMIDEKALDPEDTARITELYHATELEEPFEKKLNTPEVKAPGAKREIALTVRESDARNMFNTWPMEDKLAYAQELIPDFDPNTTDLKFEDLPHSSMLKVMDKMTKDELLAPAEDYVGEHAKEVDTRLYDQLKKSIDAARKKEIETAKIENRFDEGTFNTYNETLKSLAGKDRVESQTLRDIAEMGRQAGLDIDTVVNDLIDNTPKLSNNSNKAWQAANRAFRKGESGFISMKGIFDRVNKRAAGSGIEDTVAEAQSQIDAWEKYFTKPERVIGRMGDHGQRLEHMIEDAQYQSDAMKGKVGLMADEIFKTLTPREIGQRTALLNDGKEILLHKGNFDKYVDWEGGNYRAKKGVKQIKRMKGSLSNVILDGAEPASPKIAQAAEQFRQMMDTLGDEAEQSGVSILSSGKYIPFTKSAFEGWPRGYTDGFYKSMENNPAAHYKIVREVSKAKGIAISEAEKLLSNKRLYSELTSRDQVRNALKQDSFVIDPDVLYDYLDNMSHRIGLAKALGPRDIKGALVSDEITKLANEGWDHRFASNTIERLVGKEGTRDIPTKGEATLYKTITDLNNARLMTGFIFNNLGGVNSMIARVGVKNTFKGFGAMMGNLEVARRMSNLSGAIRGGVIERGGSTVGKILGVPMSEKFLRTWADQSGRITVNGLVDHLNTVKQSSPEFLRGKKLLDSLLGKDSIETIERGSATTAELSRAGWQLSKDAHGLINPGTFPSIWQDFSNNMLGNLSLQYKRMATQGMGSMIESLKTNPKRGLAAIFVTGPIIGELIGDAASATFGAISGIGTGEGPSKAALEEVNRRGESLGNAMKPILQDKLGLDKDQSTMVARYFEDMNRGFVLGLIGDFVYSNAYLGSKAVPDMIAGGAGPAYEFMYDVVKSIMDDGKDLIYTLAPQRLGSSFKRSQTRIGTRGLTRSNTGFPTVRPPRLPAF